MLQEELLISFLKRFDDYPFLVKINGRKYRIGEGKPVFTVKFHKMIPFTALAASTSIALGEAYMDGTLEIEGDLYDALDHFLGQVGKFSREAVLLKKLMPDSFSKKRQRREVSSHYDIGNDFYRLWLDETMSYSCGYFREADDTLYRAQANKAAYILQKLHLEEGMEILDIGCGWGYLLTEAVKKYKVRGTGITLSHEQCKAFRKKIKAEGLEDRLSVRLMDYRDLPRMKKQFDRVVSVGMMEHVGRKNYPLFLECINQVLKEGGVCLLHFISALKEYPGDAWIRKYIFPGGMIPSLRETVSHMAEENFHILDVENLRLHYNRTLLCWLKNYREHTGEVEEMFDERFVRMWDLYLAACAAVFHNGIVDVHQILATKGVNNDLPVVRWY